VKTEALIDSAAADERAPARRPFITP